jgi:hypothetical protein
MKIAITHYGNKHIWKAEHDEQELEEVIQQIKGLLVAVGFHPSSVDEQFSPDTFEWFPEEDGPMAISQEDDAWKYAEAYGSLNGSECPPGMVQAPKLDQGDHDCIPATPVPEEVDFDGIKIMMSGVPKDKKT